VVIAEIVAGARNGRVDVPLSQLDAMAQHVERDLCVDEVDEGALSIGACTEQRLACALKVVELLVAQRHLLVQQR